MCLFLILKIRLWFCVGVGVCITLLSFLSNYFYLLIYKPISPTSLFSLTVWEVSFIFVSLGQEQYFSGSGYTLNVDYTKG